MAAFYLYKFATGGNHFPAAKTEWLVDEDLLYNRYTRELQ